jgi:hypothetical protein
VTECGSSYPIMGSPSGKFTRPCSRVGSVYVTDSVLRHQALEASTATGKYPCTASASYVDAHNGYSSQCDIGRVCHVTFACALS